uniref:Uncharacterized protein n=1 Tax=Fundulus heteroclitus TaxID=8078 RepID=A0A3Q2PV97_FUNHE
MCTRGLKVSCRYSSVNTDTRLLSEPSAPTSPRLNLMLLQLVDLHLEKDTPELQLRCCRSHDVSKRKNQTEWEQGGNRQGGNDM